MFKVTLINLKTKTLFDKHFETEFERDKFIKRSKYFKNIKIIQTYKNLWND